MRTEELKQEIERGPLAKYTDRLVALAKPTVIIKAEPRNRVAYKSSKFGGNPDLPDDLKWPVSKNGQPHTFIAQLNLNEIERLDEAEGLPAGGIFYLFFDLDGDEFEFDFMPLKILFQSDQSLTRYPKERPDPPADTREPGLVKQAFALFGLTDSAPPPYKPYKECAVSFENSVSLPVGDSRSIEALGLTKAEQEDYGELWEWLEKRSSFKKNVLAWLLGYPCPVQHADMDVECYLRSIGRKDFPKKVDAEIEAGASEWMLLMQLSAIGNECDMYWGDGMVYIWCKRADLANSDFSKCKGILQTT